MSLPPQNFVLRLWCLIAFVRSENVWRCGGVGNGITFLQVLVKVGQIFQKRKLCNSEKTLRQHNDPISLGRFRVKCMYVRFSLIHEYLYRAVEPSTESLSKCTTSTLWYIPTLPRRLGWWVTLLCPSSLPPSKFWTTALEQTNDILWLIVRYIADVATCDDNQK